MAGWTVADMPPQVDRLAVVTGATGGLGYETALALAGAGAEVLVTGRNAQKGRLAVERILSATPGAKARFELLDLASLISIRAFAERLLQAGRPVDLLIDNAGVMDLPKLVRSQDGFEMQFGVNHLGHFALTGLLLPLLRAGQAPRVVNVSSLAHRGGKIDFENLQGERQYRSWPAYQQSKLANLLFTLELNRRSLLYGWGLTALAAHPGYARTGLIANGPGAKSLKGRLSRILGLFLSHSAARGALPTLFAATSAAAVRNGFYGPNGFYELTGDVAPAKIAAQAKDAETAKKLWTVSEAYTGVVWPERE